MRGAQSIATSGCTTRRIFTSSTSLPAIVLMASVLSGCGSEMAAVQGSVAHEGKPLSGGKIIFTPVAEGQPAFGMIQPDGTFQLSTQRENDGARAGQYRVSVLGDRPAKEGAPRMIFSAPEEFSVDIRSGQNNEVPIHIRAVDGWRATQND
jgi:hypothetical protein